MLFYIIKEGIVYYLGLVTYQAWTGHLEKGTRGLKIKYVSISS